MNRYRLIWVGVALGALFWCFDSGIDAFFFYEGRCLIDELLYPEPVEIWMRSTVWVLLITFASYAQHLQEARQSALDALQKAHDGLELQVQERTAELERSNTMLQEEVSERTRTEATLQSLSHQLLTIQENERRHLAHELHDEIGQALTTLKVNVQVVGQLVESPAIEKRLAGSAHIIDRTLPQVRDLSLDLRPSLLDDLGLEEALSWYIERQAARVGL